MMKNYLTFFLNLKKQLMLLMLFSFAAAVHSQTLVWSEEFTDATVNTNVWAYDFGNGSHEGVTDWGNSELQYYTSRTDNVYISDEVLHLEAKSESFDGKSFTSGRINTEGRVHFKYGTLEAKIQIPDLQDGLWPAFWLMGATGGSWPAVGEIDIAEWGNADAITDGVINKRVGGAVHWEYEDGYAGYGNSGDYTTDLHNGYHIYKLVWTETMITCYVDEMEYYAVDISDVTGNDMEEFHNMKYIILNLAVGGTYTGISTIDGITATLPAQMKVDYIRLYQDETGELWLGEDEAECGEYGVFTETTSVSDQLDYGTEANLYTWNGLTTASTAAYEGNEVMSFTTSADTWFGLGVSIEGRKNMSSFYEGSLKFHLKTDAPGNITAGISTGHGDTWITLTEEHGYSNDNNWNEITIPFSEFYNLDLGSVKQMIMITGDVPTSSFNLDIDNIYYSGGEACTSSIPVTGISISPTSLNLTEGETQQLSATITPADADNQNVSYSSSNTSIAAVSSSGLVTAIAAGSATITVSSTDGGFTATTALTVESIPTVTDLKIEAEDYTAMSGIQTQTTEDTDGGENVGWIDAGDYMDYSVTIPSSGTYTINYRVASLSNGGDFTLTSDGSTIDNITFEATDGWQNWTTISSTVDLSAGTQTIRITSNSTGWNINWFEFVAQEISTTPVSGVSLSPTAATLSIGDTQQLSATISPADADDQSVSYTSSNSTIASVSASGFVTAAAAGSATITVTTNDGSFTATCSITVEEEPTTGESIRIEAEDYSDMSGIQTQATEDTDGGDNVGWIGVGDWMEYTVTIATAGTYQVDYRVASPYSTGEVELMVDGSTLATTTIPNTGNWQTWETVSTEVTLSAGTQTIRLYASGTSWNINWFELTYTGSNETPATDCSVASSNGEYNVIMSSDSENPTITFEPILSGAGDDLLLVYYSTDPDATFAGAFTTPNEAYTVNASAGETVYVYYTYSLSAGGEHSTYSNPNSFTVGDCSSLKAAKEASNEKLAQNSITVYPNPVKSMLTVDLGASAFNAYSIFDITGKLVISNNIALNTEELNIDFESFDSGMYTIVLRSTETYEVVSVLKN